MKVYTVTKSWTDDDGWPKGSDSIEGTFLDKDKAKQFIYDQTKSPTALKYGFADVVNGRSMYRWRIKTLEVIA